MRTLRSDARAETKVKRSRFICLIRAVAHADEARAVVAEMAAAHEQARHHCWAYVLGLQGETFHCSDAGEPSGSAGKPILGVLRRNELSDVVAVVTRYFGGVKLGVRGLMDAYAEVTALAVEGADLEALVARRSWTVTAPYADYDRLCHGLRALGATIAGESFSARVTFQVSADEERAVEVEGFLGPFEGAGEIEVIR